MILGGGGSSKSIKYALNLVKSEATIISRTNKEEAISMKTSTREQMKLK